MIEATIRLLAVHLTFY